MPTLATNHKSLMTETEETADNTALCCDFDNAVEIACLRRFHIQDRTSGRTEVNITSVSQGTSTCSCCTTEEITLSRRQELQGKIPTVEWQSNPVLDDVTSLRAAATVTTAGCCVC